jgi:hypothetical protein
LPIFVYSGGTSEYGVGAYLFQVNDYRKELPVQFSPSRLTTSRRGGVPSKRVLPFAICLCPARARALDSRSKVHPANRSQKLTFLNAQASFKVTRWKLAILDYHYVIDHIPGRSTWSLTRCPVCVLATRKRSKPSLETVSRVVSPSCVIFDPEVIQLAAHALSSESIPVRLCCTAPKSAVQSAL